MLKHNLPVRNKQPNSKNVYTEQNKSRLLAGVKYYIREVFMCENYLHSPFISGVSETLNIIINFLFSWFMFDGLSRNCL